MKLLFIVLSSIILVACGGGGATTSVAPQTVDRTLRMLSIESVNTIKGDAPATSIQVPFKFTGTLADRNINPVQLKVDDPDGIFINATVSGSSSYDNAIGFGTAVLTGAAPPKAGIYTGDLLVHFCASVNTNQCINEYSGSPLKVQKRVEIKTLTLDKSGITFLTPYSATDSITVTNTDSFSSTANSFGVSATWVNNSCNSSINGHFSIPIVSNKQITIQKGANYTGDDTCILEIYVPGYSVKRIYVSTLVARGLESYTTPIIMNIARNAGVVEIPALNLILKGPYSSIIGIAKYYDGIDPNLLQLPVNLGSQNFPTPSHIFVDTNAFSNISPTYPYTWSGLIQVFVNTLGVVDSYSIPFSITLN